ncbi:MAG: histidinol-phosphate transaminase [Calditrichaeota bacterium]|nr:MAG: histidinol-phosphate transaminase [Calditrichota bacterium]MBL1205619.1 histidinol-phosphate transaminase [Calditrichota bacterium]NOG45447.1 histidinol-phosphate transaminase [Calditrichota bacterium]
MEIEKLLRKNIKAFKPYSSARDEYTGEVGIFLDANENSLGSVLELQSNRYPDPYQSDLKNKLSQIKNIPAENTFLGNGSDEAIDLLIRAFCEPREDSVIIMPPTYGMYKVCADLNDVKTIDIPLNKSFNIEIEPVLKSITKNTKLIFLCSPNNPSGNLLQKEAIEFLLEKFSGLVIVDEAYIDFAEAESWTGRLNEFENLVVLQTFSKAWGLAGLRLGMAFAHQKIIQILNNIKYPYNVNMLTQTHVENALQNVLLKEKMVQRIHSQRTLLEENLKELRNVQEVFPSDSNFLLVRFSDAKNVYQKLLQKQIIVRDRSSLIHCENCLRITVGTELENQKLINTLKEIEEGK